MPVSDDFAELVRREYLEPEGEWAVSRVERVMKAAELRRGERVLDLGCAFGTFSHHSKLAGASPVGLDRSERSLREGVEIARRFHKPDVPRIQGDACYLPFRSDQFDIIINADFIEHTTDRSKALIFAEMYRTIRHGGRGLVYSPNLNRVRWELRGETVKKLLGLRREPVPKWMEFVDPDHFGMTTARQADKMLRQAGFTTRLFYYEFHIPLLSKIPGFNRVARPFLASHFANRYLITLRKH